MLAGCGTIPTIELLATAEPAARGTCPSCACASSTSTDLFALARPEAHPHGMAEAEFNELFTEDKPVIFNFHGYASAIHQLIHRRPAQERFHVRGYAEEGTTTTPFDLLAMNGVDRYQLAIEALRRVDIGPAEACAACPASSRSRTIAGRRSTIDEADGEAARSSARTCREEGNDPPEITEWTWSRQRRAGTA